MSPSPTSPDAAEQPTASEPAAGAPEGKPSRKEKTPKGKDAKEKEGKEPKPKSKGAPGSEKADKFVPDNPNFRYIVRVSDTDLDGRRRTVLALTGVKGVGIRIAESAVRMAGVDPNERIGNLPESAVETIEGTLASLPSRVPAWMTNHPHDYATGETFHYFGPDLETSRRDDVNQMKMIRSYRGVRHERGQKVRGQRTRSNGRTGMAAGVLKKTAKEAAQAKAAEEGGGRAARAATASAPAAAAPAAPAAAAPAKGKE